MARVKIASLLLLTLLLVSSISAQELFGYGRTRELPLNYSLIPTVNNTLYWDGNAFDAFRWIENGGGNVNQNMNFGSYNVSASWFFGNFNGTFYGDGSQLTGVNIDTSEFMFTNGTNADTLVDMSGSNVSAHYVFADIGNFTELFTSNGTLTIGNVSMSSSNDTIFVEDNKSLFADFLIGDGSGIYNLDLNNISFSGGNITAVNILASRFFGSKFYGSEFIGGNFTGTDFFGGNFSGVYDWTAQEPYLNFNGTYLTFNESQLNSTISEFVDNLTYDSLTLNGTTITDFSQINYTVGSASVTFNTPSVSGSYSTVLPDIFNFEIAQIIVEPSVTTGNYRFAMYETSGETIDADRIAHTDTWNIFKSYPIDGQVSLNFTSVTPAKSFEVRIKYFTNVAN